MHNLTKKLRSALTVQFSAVRLQCSFFNQTALFFEDLYFIMNPRVARMEWCPKRISWESWAGIHEGQDPNRRFI